MGFRAPVVIQSRDYYNSADNGLIAWTFDALLSQGNNIIPAAGTLQLVKIYVPTTALITNIITQVTVAGVTLTSGQCFAGIYQGLATGSLLGTTADLSTIWQSTGHKIMALSPSPITLSAGNYYIGLFANGTTLPKFQGPALNNEVNWGMTPAQFASGQGSLTTSLPANIASFVPQATPCWWFGLS